MEKSMMIVACTWQEKPSFKLISLSNECPYNEIMFDSDQKILVIISKDQKSKPHLLPKINGKGQALQSFDKNDKGEKIQVPLYERVMMDMYYEHYIEEMDDIKAIINYIAFNPKHEVLAILDIKKVATKKPIVKKLEVKK